MIVPMKKATLYGLLSEREDILLGLQKCGQFMSIQQRETDTALEQDVQQTTAAIRFLSKYEGKQPFLPQREEKTAEQVFAVDEEARRVREEATDIREKLASLRAQARTLEGQAEGLEPWTALDEPLDQIKNTKYARVITGFAAERNMAELLEALDAAGAEVLQLGLSPEGRALLIICHAANEAQVRDAFKFGFSESALPKLEKTATKAQQEYRAEAAQLQKEIEALEAQAAECAAQTKRLKAHYDSLVAERERKKVDYEGGDAAFMTQGWVRVDMVEKVEKALSSVTDAYAIEYADPAEDDDPPVFTKNNKIVTPFEYITDLYARPKYGRLDPNPIMAPFYFLFFGMMVSDAAYGLVMTIGMLLFNKFWKPRGNFKKLIGVLVFGSLSTLMWGIMFGGYFGVSLFPPVLVSPLEQPMEMLIICYALGIIHLFTAMGVKMYIDFKDKDPLAAIFDTGSWFVIYAGIALLALGAVMGFPTTIGAVVAIIGVLMILLMKGRDKSNWGSRIVSGLGSLYDITGFLSDVLSYSRLFAMGLATGVIAMVFNTIGQMIFSLPIPGLNFVLTAAFLAFGHVFNIALNALGAFVHAARLQYIEFYGKFYESGGKAFQPLAINPKYIEVVESKAAN